MNSSKFLNEFFTLLNKYNLTLEEYDNLNQPEGGFFTNFRSIRVVGPNVNVDLFELAKKINVL